MNTRTNTTQEADVSPIPERIPNDELLAELQAGAAVLGRAPTQREMKQFGEYGPSVYRHRFGSWIEALERAGVYVSEKRKRDAGVAVDG